MPQIQERLEVEFDEDGLLKNPAQWNEAVATEIALHDGIGKLTDEHWEVIHSLREHYAKFGVAPAMSHVCRSHGKDRQWIHDLFHTCLNAWRVAGLPNPGEEAKAYLNDM
ncbi:MAG: sulfurtransferase TusE [Sulfuricaulis sp.]